MRTIFDLPDQLAPLADVIAEALVQVRRVFDQQLRSDLPPVSKLCRHIEHYRGKMLRPTLTIVTGIAAHPRAAHTDPAALGPLVTREHLVIAAVCEMVHMATLVHDDVLDEADTRRRGDTVNRLHGNEAAVILGDYLIASAYHLCSTISGPLPRGGRAGEGSAAPASSSPESPLRANPALAIARAAMVTCAGELLQLHHRDDYSLDELTYYEVVARKTAELIATSAELGAAQSGAPEHVCHALADFGRKLGIAFQIQDDLLDLTGKESVVGKSVGKDLEKGKMTLPFVHHLANADARTRGRTLLMLEAAADPGSRAAADLAAALESTGSITYARTTAERFVREAVARLDVLEESPAKAMLHAMADAVITRTY